mgnify:CR=1 FL=1
MIKRLFLGTTEVNFINVGKTFYKFFIVEVILFVSVITLSLFGLLNVNLSVDFKNLPMNRYANIIEMVIIIFLIHSSDKNSII